MKKFLSAALALTIGATGAVGFLAGCGKDDAKAAEEAIQYVILQHKSDPELTEQSYKLLGVAPASNGKLYNVSWSVSAPGYNMNDYIKLGAMDDDNEITANVYRSKTDVDIAYTLTATVKVGKKKASCSFSKTLVPMGDVYTVAQVLAFDTSKFVTISGKDYYSVDNSTAAIINVKGYVVDPGTYSSQYKNYTGMYIADTKSGTKTLEVYGLKPDDVYVTADKPLEKDDYVVLNGAIQNYNGKLELTYQGSTDAKCIELDREEISDADRVAAVKDSFSLSTNNFTAPTNVPLTTSSQGVTISWAVKGTSSNVEIIDDTLYVKSIPLTATTVTLVATFKFGKATATKEFPITLAPVTNKGTLENPYTAAEANALGATLGSGDYYTENGVAKAIHVKGWVVDPGAYETGANYKNFNRIYIADTYSEDMDKDSAGTFYVYRVQPDSTYLKGDGDLEKGDLATFVGYLQNYVKDGVSTIELTYHDKDNVYCVGLEKPNMTDEQKMDKALAAVDANITVTTAGEYPLPESTIAGVTLVWATTDTTYTITGNKLNVASLPESPATVTATVTAKIGTDKSSAPKTVTITIKQPTQAGQSAKFDFSSASTKTGTGLTDATALTLFKNACSTESGLVSVGVTNMYDGTGSGGGKPNASGIVKAGKSGTGGEGQLVLTFEAQVTKIEIKCHDFYAKNDQNPTNSNKISVNGSADQLLPYNVDADGEVMTFNLTSPSTVVTIDFKSRAYIYEIIVYFA